MTPRIDPKVRALAKKVIADGKNKRAILALKAMLKKGSISTDELKELGYNHPPRAIGDVRDAGIPVVTRMVVSEGTKRRMAVYSFGDPSQIQYGRFGGRSALPKSFKAALVKHYGSIDGITGAVLDERLLQIDHRVPYRIAGDLGLAQRRVQDYMLLDASSQRSKSWSCEHCKNMLGSRDQSVCKTCFWAYPEHYDHIATAPIRRTDVVWQGADVPVYERLRARADKKQTSVAEVLRGFARQKTKDS